MEIWAQAPPDPPGVIDLDSDEEQPVATADMDRKLQEAREASAAEGDRWRHEQERHRKEVAEAEKEESLRQKAEVDSASPDKNAGMLDGAQGARPVRMLAIMVAG